MLQLFSTRGSFLAFVTRARDPGRIIVHHGSCIYAREHGDALIVLIKIYAREHGDTHLSSLNYQFDIIAISGSDYVSGARTNYRNSMCPASGYVTARKNCCKPIFCPAPGKYEAVTAYFALFVRRVSK